MYLPRHFEAPALQAMQALIGERPLATLVAAGAQGLSADHIPVELDATSGPHGTLRGHVARANPLWRDADGAEVLAVFQGPQTYVSPSWYPGKALHGKVVPTWNYAVVHAHGRLRAVDDAPWLRALVERLTTTHEATFPVPWAVGDAPADYLEQMLRAIVGIEITLTRLVGKWKTSQNRDHADRAGVAAGLAALGSNAAREMADLVRGTDPA